MKTTQPMARRKPPMVVSRPAQLRALASPVRQEIVDTVQALGQAAVTEIATHLGRPADGLYYHLRALQSAGLLRVAGERRGRDGRPQALYSTTAPERGMRLRYERDKPAALRPLKRLVGSMLRTAQRDFERGLGEPARVLDGPRRELWAARANGWLSDAELAELNRLLRSVNALLARGPGPGRRRMASITFVLAPVAARPPRRAAAAGGSTRRRTLAARRRRAKKR
jgi:DNA-binding transcriptional ArsR family regulator